MAASPLALAAGALLIVAGLAVLVLRRGDRASVLLFALFALWSGAGVAGSIVPGAGSPGEAMAAARVAVWYTIPIPLLMLAVAPSLLDATHSYRRVVLAAALLTAAGCAAMALWRGAFVEDVVAVAGRMAVTSGPLLYLLGAATTLTSAGIALHAARLAAGEGEPLARQRARWVAVGFAIVPLHAGGFFLAYVLALAAAVPELLWSRALPTLLAASLAAAAIGRLRRGSAVGVLLVAGVALALGLLDGLVGAQRMRGLPYGGYETSLLLVRAAWALLLATVALRFGLAGLGAAGRRSSARAAAVALGVASAVALAALAVAGLGASPASVAAGAIVGLALPLSLRRPFEAAGRHVAAALLLPPDDPRAVAERARVYAAAVAAARDAGPEGERYLAALRADLGVTAREHELLAQGLASREAPRYRSVEPLGAGATAQVELAVDEVAGKRVVVKRFKGLRDPSAALREARALAAVRHPRVVPFLEVDRRDDALFLVLAYAEGGSARQLLDREGPLPAARAVDLASDLLEGLEALHDVGLVHGDVKPENLLLDADGRGMLGDFGSARFAAPDLVDATLAGGAAEGSLSTISPEALRGAPPSPARDVYAAGALLYRLLTGEHHVDLRDATVFEARERITMDPPRLPHPRVPAAIEAVLRRALAKRPEERFGSAREMREALRRAAPAQWS